MQVFEYLLTDIKPYENNPRRNDDAVEAVAESIRQCGYVAPIIVDGDGVILAGHTRLKALQLLGYEKADVVVKEGLTEEQKRKYRLLDNKTAEFSEWDWGLLDQELEGLGFEGFDFGFPTDFDWADVPELSESSYVEPDKERLRCPLCGGVDSKTHFLKVKNEDIP